MSVCPDGWKLPSRADFENLSDLGTLLGASVGWNATLGGSKNEDEDDLVGYTPLDEGFWWASDHSGDVAYYVDFKRNGDKLDGYYGKKTKGYSVRCVQK